MVKYQPQLTIGKLEHKLRNFLLTRKLPCLTPSYFEVSGQAIFGLAMGELLNFDVSAHSRFSRLSRLSG